MTSSSYRSAADFAVGTARDVITDFVTGDKIDISQIDAVLSEGGYQGFSFAGLGTADRTVAAGTIKDDVFNGNTFIVGSVDNDDQADFQIELSGTPAVTLDSFIGLPSNLVGDGTNNVLVGTGRNDWMYGRDGDDTLTGGLGKDRLFGGEGADKFAYTSHLQSAAGDNRDIIMDWQTIDKIDLTAMDANSTAAGLQGFAFLGEGTADRTIGQGELKYYHANGNTYLVGGIDGDNQADFQIEITGNVTLTGSNFLGLASSAIVGTNSGETLTGTTGSDAIIANGGDDVLIGGLGKDVLTGGLGNDKFVFQTMADSEVGANRDTIMDFAAGDKLDLSAIDANGTLAGNDAFNFNGTNHDVNRTVAQGEVRFYTFGGNTYVIANAASDDQADIQIEIRGEHVLTAADFIL